MGIIKSLLETLSEYTKKLEELTLDDWKSFYAGIYLLQSQAQALIDIVQRGCSELGLKAENYVESGRKLMEEGIINQEEFEFYRRVVSFRNIVVHEYASINLEIVKRIIAGKEFEKVYVLALKIVEELKKRNIDP
ncbi:HepT-like ribonuclease domain-containing protein [Sulfolobaceae archaeon RB850M]